MGCGSISTWERSKAKRFRQLADEEEQAGIQGHWQHESAAPGRSEMLSRYGLQRIINEERLYRLEEWDMGRVEGNAQEKDESLRMGFRQDKRGVRVW